MKHIRLIGRKLALVAAAGAACLALAGCTDFKEQWQKALDESKKNQGKFTDLTGPWEGTWTSKFNDHTGKLRCIITKQKDGQYEFHYWAQWQKVLSGSFKANYKVTDKKNGSFTFSGAKDLGKLGGKFTHEGSTTATTFKATYQSDMGDHGVFEMKRPGTKPKKKPARE